MVRRPRDDAGPLPLAPATLFDLIDALNRVMARKPERVVYEVRTELFDIGTRCRSSTGPSAKAAACTLVDHGQARARMEIVVSFMALLELVKLGRVIVVQDANFADILIMPKQPEERHRCLRRTCDRRLKHCCSRRTSR